MASITSPGKSGIWIPKGAKYDCLVSSSLDTPYFYANYFGFAMLVDKETMTLVDDRQHNLIQTPRKNIKRIAWTENYTIYSSDGSIFSNDGQLENEIIATNGESEILFCMDETEGMVFGLEATLFALNYSDSAIQEIVTFSDTITDILYDKGICYVSSGNQVYALYDNIYKIVTLESTITSIAIVGCDTLLIGAKDGLFVYNNTEELLQVTSEPIKSVRNIDNALYVIFEDNISIRIYPAHAFAKH